MVFLCLKTQGKDCKHREFHFNLSVATLLQMLLNIRKLQYVMYTFNLGNLFLFFFLMAHLKKIQLVQRNTTNN